MNLIIEYITTNYIWFLFGAIIILLAIIGSYADKTNFGQNKLVKKEKTDKIENEVLDNQEENEKPEIQEENIDSVLEDEKETSDLNLENQEDLKEKNKTQITDEGKQGEFDKKFEELDEEFNAFLPKKDIIDDDLLSDIDDMSLDKTQKVDFSDIPDLDDLELPKIKKLKSVDEDIWKF
jgi:hypothetical protein